MLAHNYGYGFGQATTITLPPATVIQNFLDQLVLLAAQVGQSLDDFDVVSDSDNTNLISADAANRLVIINQQTLASLQAAVTAVGGALPQNQIADTDLQSRISAAQQAGTISSNRGRFGSNVTLGKVAALRTLLNGLVGGGVLATKQKLVFGGIGLAIGAIGVGATWFFMSRRRAGR